MNQETLHHALMNPETFSSPRGPVQFKETHASRLYFLNGTVYKVKKPVNFGFLDFTSLEQRRFYCHEEVRLNRRLCPDIYLGVADIRLEGGRIVLNGPGTTIDYAVVMRQLPENLLLSNLLSENDPDLPGKMPRLGCRIAEFHSRLEPVQDPRQEGSLETIRRNWQENFDQTAPFVGRTLPPRTFHLMRCWVEHFLARNQDLLRRRETEGFVREGHGDLHCEHICFTEPICIYDCIEFNRRFRVADVLADLAFLLMDLEFRGRPDLASGVLASYTEGRQPTDETARLLVFYKVYRAWVRGKVESFLCADAAAPASTRREAAAKAARYFNLALGTICPPALIATCGLMGSGKTTLAKALAGSLRGRLIRSDLLRKELAGINSRARQTEDYLQGIYSPDFSDRTYALLQTLALDSVEKGKTALADASFSRYQRRESLRRAAEGRGVPCLILHVVCNRDTMLQRLDRRQHDSAEASDGRRDLLDRQAAAFDTPQPEEDLLEVDGQAPVESTVAEVLYQLLEKYGDRS
ncbi:MAG: AAA family ATPase [Syntrophotaleaceae bacterium]